MRPCQVINFIVRTSKKYILFVCLVMYLKISHGVKQNAKKCAIGETECNET